MGDRAGTDDTAPASSPPDDDKPTPGSPGRRYRLGAELGRGGMGRVVEAFDLQLGRTVALKEVLPRGGAGIARRFAREVQITARLEHASIVPLYDSGVTEDGRPFYVMRRVTGKPLDEMILRARGLGERLALVPAMLAAIDAVAHAHRRGVIHRDLKPANILVGELGETVVIDWGLAKVVGEDDEADDGAPVAADSLQTQLGAVFGTPGFMAPEQARGEELGTRSDVYALGATLYQLLAAKPPHAGKSATEVLSSTREHTVIPLTHECPGAPPELVAIVDKALAFEPTARYPNAAALGEDVRRFLTGQLVAAHRYTKRQRIGRFTRRHRAPLAVAALATVAVAVLAWIGVHRIVMERDAATDAREDAQRQERLAIEARDRVIERQDALILMHASAILDANATESVAVLKQLAPTSAKQVEAIGLARAASMRGVSWAMETADDLTISLELSPDTRRLAQATRDGTVRLWDLDRRRLMVAKHYAGLARVIWVKRGSAVLVSTGKLPPELLDVASGGSAPLAVPALGQVVGDEVGDRIAGLDMHGNALAVELASGTVTALWPGHPVREIRIAGDGSWISLDDGKHLVVVDPTGAELAHREGEIKICVVSGGGKLAVLDGDEIHELTLTGGARWTTLPPTATRPQTITYRGERVVVLLYSFNLDEITSIGFHTIGHLDPIAFPMTEAGDGRLVVASGQGRIDILDGLGSTTLAVPGDLPHVHVVARRDQSRLVVVGDGIILDYDLDSFVPRAIATGEANFVDDDTILLWAQALDQWRWYDLPSRTTRTFRYDQHGLVVISSVDPTSGRALVKELAGPATRLVILDKHGDRQTAVCEGDDVDGRLLEGGGAICSRGAKLFVARRDERAHELITLEGPVGGMVQLDRTRFAAASPTGEVVRGNFETGDVERIHIDPSVSAFVGADHQGHALIVADNRLLLWDHDAVEIGRFAQSITQISPVAGGVLVSLADHESVVIDLRPGAVPHRILPSNHELNAMTNADGTMAAGLGVGGQIVVVDFPSRTRWTLPVRYDASSPMLVSPNGRWILQRRTVQHYMLWPLPAPPDSDIGSWLDDMTNATEDQDGVLTWPWQSSSNTTRP